MEPTLTSDDVIQIAKDCGADLAGIAGALYVPQVGIINPSEFAPAASIEIVIWVAIGGRGSPQS